MSKIKSCHCLIPPVGALSRGIGTQRIPTWVDYSGYSKVEATAPFLTTCLQLHQRCPPIRLILCVKYMFSKYEICKNQMYMQVALDKTSQEPPLSQIFRLLSRSHKGCIFQNPEFVSGIKYQIKQTRMAIPPNNLI